MSVSRRNFLRVLPTAGAGAAMVAAGATTLPSCGNDVEPAPYVDGSANTSGQVILNVTRYPDLTPIGGAITIRLQQVANQASLPFTVPPGILLVHYDDTTYIAMNSACNHKGCPLGYNASAKLVECPCHSSQFLAVADPAKMGSCSGDVVHAPASSPQITYAATLGDDNLLTIDLTTTSPGCDVFPALASGKITFAIADYPTLGSVGGVEIGASQGAGKLAVYRQSETVLVAVTAICPHLGCTVGYDSSKKDWLCPCHQSRFQIDGTLVNGPATSGLTEYPVTFDGTTVTIAIS